MLGDTITAIATSQGAGGIGIVRISGSESLEIINKLFKPVDQYRWREKKYSLHYGHLYYPYEPAIDEFEADSPQRQLIDEVLVGVMLAPHSYTTEDVVEINCHGGASVLRTCLMAVLSCGARLAEPGEFTKRAFLNGRLDLVQAEAIIDLINAHTDKARTLASGQLAGDLSDQLTTIKKQLLNINTHLEAYLEFPEEDIEALDMEEIKKKLSSLEKEINRLNATAQAGRIYKDGISVSILGKPNVGKSSLLNVLINEEKAIVTNIPGTTRDIIEEFLNISGIPVKIIDTAGIRQTEELIETIGVNKTKASAQVADFILLVLDGSQEPDELDRQVIELVLNKKGLTVINKIDQKIKEIRLIRDLLQEYLPEWPVVEISALQKSGIEQLKEAIVKYVIGKEFIGIEQSNQIMITNLRHSRQLMKAADFLKEAQGIITEGMQYETPFLDLAAIDIRGAWEAICEIDGYFVTEDIIDEIFAKFCIGK